VSNPVQHSHDFFVISSCAVQAKLQSSQVSSSYDEVYFYFSVTYNTGS
jgi:hypothetical protein